MPFKLNFALEAKPRNIKSVAAIIDPRVKPLSACAAIKSLSFTAARACSGLLKSYPASCASETSCPNLSWRKVELPITDAASLGLFLAAIRTAASVGICSPAT